MRLLLLISLLLSSLAGFSQLTMMETVTYDGSSRDSIIGPNFTVTNTGSTTELFYWDLIRGADMADEWQFSVCDQVLCTNEGQERSECDPAFLNVLEPGESITWFKVGLHPNDVSGTNSVTLRLVRVCEDITEADVIARQIVTYNVSGTSDTHNLSKQVDNSILIYPNPTSDRFQINEDSDITNISIYNIVGKKIAGAPHFAGKSHDISDLDKGIYLVRMLDATQEVVKVLRLTKE